MGRAVWLLFLHCVCSGADSDLIGAAIAQEAQPVASTAEDDLDVVVIHGTANRQSTSTSYEVTLDAVEIAAQVYADTEDLLSDLAGSLGIDPAAAVYAMVVLIDGRPAMSADEVASIPVNSISSVTILTGNQSVRLGYAPNQYIVAIVLKTTGIEYSLAVAVDAATPGGRQGGHFEPGVFFRSSEERFAAVAKLSAFDGRTSAEKGLRKATGTADRNSDAPSSREESLRLDYSRTLVPRISASFGLDLRQMHQENAIALDDVSVAETGVFGGPRRVADSKSVSIQAGVNGALYAWRFDANVSHAQAFNQTVSMSAANSRDLLSRERRTQTGRVSVRGPFLPLPTGLAFGSLAYELKSDQVDTMQNRATGDLSETIVDQSERLAFNAVVPLVDPTSDVATVIGAASVSFAGKRSTDSRQTNTSSGSTVDWISPQGLRVRLAREHGAFPKGIDGQAETFLEISDASVFDPLAGKAVIADVVTGGNTLLPTVTSDVTRIDLTFRPPRFDRLSVHGRYENTELDNFAFRFSRLTSSYEQAYPDRIVRDGAGVLKRIDLTPVLVGESFVSNMQLGFSLKSDHDSLSASDTLTERWEVSVFYRQAISDEIFWHALGRRQDRQSALPGSFAASGNAINLSARYARGEASVHTSVRIDEGQLEPDSGKRFPEAYAAKVSAIWRPTGFEACGPFCDLVIGATLRVDATTTRQSFAFGVVDSSTPGLQDVNVVDYRVQVGYEKRF